MNDDFLCFMQVALEQAKLASDKNEVPIGAIVVLDNTIIGIGHNSPISTNCPTSHAEVLALNDAAKNVQNYRLIGADIYTTLEPCLMCFGAMVHARIRRCIYAAKDPKSGVVANNIVLEKMPMLNHKVDFIQGPCAAESSSLLQSFFQSKRKK